MNVDEIRKIAKRRPFKPFIFDLDNGEKQAVLHPEIVVGNEIIVAIDDNGKSIMIVPEAVSSIEFMEAESVIAGTTP
jgi:hypothetical protein